MVALDVFQSMWAMEFKRPDGFEWTLREKIEKIAGAGFKGVSFDLGYHTEEIVEEAMPLLQEFGLDLCYPSCKAFLIIKKLLALLPASRCNPVLSPLLVRLNPGALKTLRRQRKHGYELAKKVG